MRTGFLFEIVDYYSNNPKNKVDFDRAILEFFECLPEEVSEQLYLENDGIHMLFNEWFIFDFKMSNGKKVIVDFCERNPLNNSFFDLELYKNLQNNECGFFCIISSKPGRVEIESLQKKKIYVVREYSAATDLKPDQTIMARIVWTGERYEFSSINNILDLKMSASLKNFHRNSGIEKLTAKDIYQMLYTDKKIKNDNENENDNFLFGTEEEEGMTSQKAEEQAEEAFKKCGILDFVSVKKVKKWIYEKEKNDYSSFPLLVLNGLVSPDAKKEDLNFLMRAVSNLLNYSPRKMLKGKCPFEMKVESGKSSLVGDIIDLGLYIKFANKSIDAIKNKNMEDFLINCDLYFEELLKNKIVDREVYRMFANKGAFLLAKGNFIGEVFLKLSLEINPRYDFAKKQLKRFDKGDFNENILDFICEEMPELLDGKISRKKFQKIMQEKIDEEFEKDIARKYFDWLVELDINFSKYNAPKSKIIGCKNKKK